MSFVNKKFHDESIEIFNKLNVSRERIDGKSESNILIRHDKKGYDISIEIVNGEFLHYCTCSHRSDAKACAHAGAILINKMLKKEKNEFNTKPRKLLKVQETHKKNYEGIDYFKNLFPKKEKESQKNIIYFNFEDFRNGEQKLRLQRGVIKNDGSYSSPMKFTGKDFNFNRLKISKNVRKLLSFIMTGESFGMGYIRGGFSKNRFDDTNTDSMMPLFKEIYFEEERIIRGASFAKENFHISFETSKNSSGNYVLRPFFMSGKKRTNLANMDISEIGLNSLWVFDNNERIFYQHKDCARMDAVKDIIRFPKELILTEKELKVFFSKYYQEVLDSFEFKVSEAIKREKLNILPKTKLYLEKEGVKIKINLRFDYGGREIDYFSETKDILVIKDDFIFDISRDNEEEERIVELLKENGVIINKKLSEFNLEEDLVDFVVYGLPVINGSGVSILGEKNLFDFKVVKGKPKMDLKVKSGVDWMDIKGGVQFGKDRVQIESVLEAIFQNKRFVDLGDGKKGAIPKNWISELKAYNGFFKNENGGMELSKYHMPVLESIIGLSNVSELDGKVKENIKKYKEIGNIRSVKISKNITAELRNYQQKGYDWLNFLRDNDFNGILADDMGLGKTLQSLCLLQKIKDEGGNKPFLVIVPTSLVFNWKNEIEKFSPQIKTYLHHGGSRVKGEKNFVKALKNNDLIVTTYGILRNDLSLFSMQEFEYIILDEAHTIKNPLSANAKSVNLLKGKNKLAISGTPIQNNLMELWSLFNFISPGYLGSYDSFKENFVLPIEVEKDENAVRILKKMVGPFLMKRSKDVIADELPEKTEQVLKSEFNEEERIVYENWKTHYSSEITQSIKEKGFGRSKMKVLEGITKLRQVCLHPKMVDKNYTGSSAKFDLLMLEVEKVLSKGHKVLIFSSFVKMLSIIQDEFKKKGIIYSYLDGKSKNREKIVKDFQESKTALPFLISIKAGGVGINLTSADYVFVVDPWWNPAVEMQAMDRAHRIGQTKPVFVYKMIAEDSIEEKILELQESKKNLVNDVIQIEKGIAKEMDSKMIEEIFG